VTEQKTNDRAPDAAHEDPPARLPDEEYYRRPRAPKSSGSASRLGAALVIAGLIWLAVELIGYGPFFGGAGDVTRIAGPLPNNRIELDLGRGDVTILPGSEQEIRVETTQYGLWQGNPAAVSRSADGVRVMNEARPGFLGLCIGRCGLSYQITLPRATLLIVQTSSGDINVSGVEGAVSLTSSSGDVEAHEIPNGMTASTSSGDVELTGVGGKLDVQTSSGDVRLEAGRVAGATVRTNSGDIELDGVANTLALQSNSGSITVRDARDARLDIQNSSGEVDYTGSLASAADSSIATSSGDVTLRLPAGSGFVLEAGTSSGDLRSDFELRDGQRAERTLSGVAGAGGARLKIATSSGDITIARQ
jgi:DUF4097 and DUF4098 domain-containing protein YvlB